MNALPVYAGSVIIVLWGIAHILPVRSIVAGFGDIAEDNRKIITMEWVASGLAMIFTGMIAALAVSAGGADNPVSRTMVLASAGMLIVLAALTALTGARTVSAPMKLCPFVTTFAALLILAGVFL